MEIGIMLYINCEACPVEKQIEILKSLGIKRTFLSANHPRLDEVMELVNEAGLICDNFHGAFNEPDGYKMNDLHKPGEAGEIMLARLFDNILSCAKHNVPLLVVHIPDEKPQFVLNEFLDERYKRLGDFARECGVTLVFENTVGHFENFNRVYELIPDAKFCWDNGHNFLFSTGKKLATHFGDRLAALHITDNFGSNDDHLIPFDGAIDFETVAEDIANTGYRGTLMLELIFRGEYAQKMSYEDFALRAKSAAEKLVAMIENKRR